MTGNRHRGFTLIELLIVMGIMMMLAGMAALAYQKLDKVAGDNSTRSRLQICASLEAEYEAQAPINMIEGIQTIMNPFPKAGTILTPDNAVYEAAGLSQRNNSPFAIVPFPLPPPLTYLYIPTNPGSVNLGSGSRYSTPYLQLTPIGFVYFQSRSVLNTSVIMQYYSRIPAMQSTIAQLPSSALLPTNPDSQRYTDPTLGVILPSMSPQQSGGIPDGGIGTLVVVDGWKNPIIYVPSSGLPGVYIGRLPATVTQTAAPGRPYVVRAVDGRPFWASAGSDGDFSRGDDNLYSCPVSYTTN